MFQGKTTTQGKVGEVHNFTNVLGRNAAQWEQDTALAKEREKARGIDVLQTLYCSLLPLFRESLTPELGLWRFHVHAIPQFSHQWNPHSTLTKYQFNYKLKTKTACACHHHHISKNWPAQGKRVPVDDFQ
jgi:hypothetical protein